MRTMLLTTGVVAAISFAACNTNNHPAENSSISNNTAQEKKPGSAVNSINKSSISDLTAAYLEIKNGLANDNGNDAAKGGNAFKEALAAVNKSSMDTAQQRSFEDIADDAQEMAEHIGKSAGKIEHQREHFDMLSKDMYDLVKALGAGQVLYQDFCPMYNNKKGATWLSETKEIKNPYLGSKMPGCGSVKEEIK